MNSYSNILTRVHLRKTEEKILSDFSTEEIIAMIQKYSGVKDMFVRNRKLEYVNIRRIGAHIFRKRGLTLIQIAKIFNRDHTSIIHMLRTTKAAMQMKEQSFYREVDKMPHGIKAFFY